MNRQLQLVLFAAAGVIGLVLLVRALGPLAGLVPSTAEMLQTTRSIRQETLGLEESVKQVEVQLSGLAEQEILLQQQGELIGQSLTLLRAQEASAKEATVHLRKLAELEVQTVELTTQADLMATRTAEVLRANQGALARLTTQTDRIEAGSLRMEQQVGLLLGEMAKTEQNFAPIKRWKENLQTVKERFAGAFKEVAEWIERLFR